MSEQQAEVVPIVELTIEQRQAQPLNCQGLPKMVLNRCRRVWSRMGEDEARSAAYEGLVQASAKYDPGRGTAFSTYAYAAILRAVVTAAKNWDLVRCKSGLWEDRVEVRSYDSNDGVASPGASAALSMAVEDPEVEVWESADVRLVREMVGRLDPRTREIIQKRVLPTGKPATFVELGELFGVSKERARQIEQKGLSRLRRWLVEARQNKGVVAR